MGHTWVNVMSGTYAGTHQGCLIKFSSVHCTADIKEALAIMDFLTQKILITILISFTWNHKKKIRNIFYGIKKKTHNQAHRYRKWTGGYQRLGGGGQNG